MKLDKIDSWILKKLKCHAKGTWTLFCMELAIECF